MRSKIISVALSAVFLINTGCGLKLGEKNKAEKVVELKTASCLDQSMKDLKSFFAGDATGDQLSESLICLQSTLKDFQTNIRGKNKDAYTPDEISNFVNKQFIKNSSLSMSDLMTEVMKLKVVLVGGSHELLTKTELNGITDIISRLKPELAKLAPHMKIIVSKWQPEGDESIDETKFVKAKEALDAFLNRVGNLVASTERSYELNDLMNLVIEAANFAKASPEILNKIINAKLLIIKFKKSLIGGGTALTGKEWLPFTRTLSEAYSLFLRYKYFYNHLKENQQAEKWKVHQKAAKDVAGLLGDLLSFKESHVFTTQELSDLILTAQNLKYLNSRPDQKKFDQKILNSLFTALWNNILVDPRNRLADKKLSGFNAEALQVLIVEAGHFIQNQIIIGEVFSAKAEYTKEELLASLSLKNNQTGIEEMVRALSANGKMNFNTDGFLKILTETNGFYHLEDLNKANISRTIARIIIRSYANDLERVDKLTGVKQEEAQLAFDQLRDFILGLDFTDPETADSFIASRFREANLFLSVSNGDAIASFVEINHLVLHILSGAVRAKSLQKAAIDKNCIATNHEIIAKIEFRQDCLLDLYYIEEKSFADLPGFIKLKTEPNESGDGLKFTPEEIKKYYLGLLTAAGHIPNDKKIVLLRDASLFPHVVQYVEMIFDTHDTNKNGILEKEEAIKAYPVFEQTIKLLKSTSFFKDLEDRDFLGAFIWLLKKGTPFPIGTMKKFAKDYECNLNNDSKTCAHDWTLASTRIDIGKIFLLIAGLTKPKEASGAAAAPSAPVTPVTKPGS